MPYRTIRLLSKSRAYLRQLRDDPEKFGRQLLQITDPAKYEAKLVDVLALPPLQVRVVQDRPPAVNVLVQALAPELMTGGPNTVLLLAALAAEAGLQVRMMTMNAGHRTAMDWFDRHVQSVLGRPVPAGLEVHAATDPAAPAEAGSNDLWLATHWTTAQSLRPLMPANKYGWFLYLVQDFEPGFYAWSSNHALALETYAMPHRAIINERLLADYLLLQRPGLYADREFVTAQCKVFEPAVDRGVFYPPATPRPGGPRRLLFYARPGNPRNLLGLALQALRAAIAAGVFAGEWEFLGLGGGGALPPLALGGGHMLRPAPWSGYAGYAGSLRDADILLCPMLSPHTSYPVLEMAACGGLVVTNTFGTKTQAALAALSPDIIGVEPSLEGLTAGLRDAVSRLPGGRQDRLSLPADWTRVLRPVAQWVADLVRQP